MSAETPIPMRLNCPGCHTLHIDEGEFATKPHHTHACQQCGMTWRPAIVPTVGVQFLPGFKNTEQPTQVGHSPTGLITQVDHSPGSEVASNPEIRDLLCAFRANACLSGLRRPSWSDVDKVEAYVVSLEKDSVRLDYIERNFHVLGFSEWSDYYPNRWRPVGMGDDRQWATMRDAIDTMLKDEQKRGGT